MALIKGQEGQESRWDFPLLEEGWHEFTIHDTIEMVDKIQEDGSTKSSLRVPLCANGNDKPSVSIFCPLGVSFGLKKVIDLVVFSGLAPILQKEKKLPDMVTSGIDEEVVRSDKFLNYIMAKLPGKQIKGEIKHQTYKDKTNANVVAIAPMSADVKTAPKSAAKAAPVVKEEGKTEEGW